MVDFNKWRMGDYSNKIVKEKYDKYSRENFLEEFYLNNERETAVNFIAGYIRIKYIFEYKETTIEDIENFCSKNFKNASLLEDFIPSYSIENYSLVDKNFYEVNKKKKIIDLDFYKDIVNYICNNYSSLDFEGLRVLREFKEKSGYKDDNENKIIFKCDYGEVEAKQKKIYGYNYVLDFDFHLSEIIEIMNKKYLYVGSKFYKQKGMYYKKDNKYGYYKTI